MQRLTPATNEIYHLYNRGVEKRTVFIEDADYVRFIHDLFEFNDTAPAPNLSYHLGTGQSKEVGLPNIKRGARKLLVELMAFCLMPNHFHLMVRQLVEGGVTLLMRKLGSGYTNYFNEKYERVGPLFQGKYKAVHLDQEAHLLHLPYYIHFNPLDLVTPEWREKKMENSATAIRFLENYRWSSYLDYIGQKNFPSVTQREFLLEALGGSAHYKKEMQQWLKGLEMNLARLDGVLLE